VVLDKLQKSSKTIVCCVCVWHTRLCPSFRWYSLWLPMKGWPLIDYHPVGWYQVSWVFEILTLYLWNRYFNLAHRMTMVYAVLIGIAKYMLFVAACVENTAFKLELVIVHSRMFTVWADALLCGTITWHVLAVQWWNDVNLALSEWLLQISFISFFSFDIHSGVPGVPPRNMALPLVSCHFCTVACHR